MVGEVAGLAAAGGSVAAARRFGRWVSVAIVLGGKDFKKDRTYSQQPYQNRACTRATQQQAEGEVDHGKLPPGLHRDTGVPQRHRLTQREGGDKNLTMSRRDVGAVKHCWRWRQ